VEPQPGGIRANAGCDQPTQMSKFNVFSSRVAALLRGAGLVFALVTLSGLCWGAEPVSTAGTPGTADDTNSLDTLRSYLQLQEQLHATQLAIEQSRTQAETAAAQNAKALAARLSDIEQSLASQRIQELETMQSSNRVMLFVAGVFAALGFLAMLFMAYFQWRTINRLAEITAALPLAHALGAGSPVAALGAGDAHLLAAGSPEQSNQRLLGALERLEKRIYELEHTARAPLPQVAAPSQEDPNPPASSSGEAAPAASAAMAETSDAARITVLLGKGQSLLNLAQAEEAVACFDQVLALDANHPDALVKKGAALERLRKLDEAVACYDRAIAADSSLTMAYLYKGGLFNRMERFSEALECYEQALHTQETRHA
jgi:tetratricopeptide (TPR) repeat protein